ncbi:MAG: TIGR02206 family membrane protein [Candidatus Krumholzibacteria bacterium]|nr:TIGR02206 family membrane protein [Candidatus Krumholzibacteria bacterium]
MSQDFLYDFQPFSPVHLGVVGFCALCWGALIVVALRWRGTERLTRVERGFAFITLLIWIVAEGYWLLPARFNVAYTLPLHLCDIAALLVPLALFYRKRFLMTLLYFWGIGLSLQAIITPALHHGLAEFEFWLFWSYHTMIVGAALYLVAVHGFRPTWRDLWLAVWASALYLAVVFPVDVIFDYNYGFVGNMRPSQPTVIDVLGPWPWRVLVMSGLVLAAMVILLLPWELRRRGLRRSR